MLVLHIGLPKTGTTFLQHRIFKETKGLRFLNRRRAGPLCDDLRRLGAPLPLLPALSRRRIRARLDTLLARRRGSGPMRLLLSEENASIDPRAFWRGRGPHPARLAVSLAALGRNLPPELAPLRVVVGIRRQDQWLASRYAESSKHFEGFCQDDFDRRMATIAAAPVLEGPLGWLDYDALERHLAAALGPGNLLLVPLERLAEAPLAVLGEMGGFLGGVDLARPYRRASAEAPAPPRNRLAEGADRWRLRRDGAPLHLAPALRDALRARFAGSNAALAARRPLGF